MRIERHLLLVWASVFFVTCRNVPGNLPGPDHSLIYGLASPIQLDTGLSTVELHDYFPNGVHADSVRCPGLQVYWTKTDSILKISAPEPEQSVHLYQLNVYTKKTVYSIPVFSGNRRKIHFESAMWDSNMQSAYLTGSFNQWNATTTPLVLKNKSWSAELYLRPGKYPYQIGGSGTKWEWQGPDPNNPNQESNGMGGINSILEVPDVEENQIPFLHTESDSGNVVIFKSSLPLKTCQVYWQNSALPVREINTGRYAAEIPKEAQKYRRTWIRVFSATENARSNDLLIPIHYGKVLMQADSLYRDDWESNVMYFPMIDRFYNGNTKNDEPLTDPSVLEKANYMGGDLEGILQKLRSGYFEQLGINAIWLSPVTQNPSDAWGQFKDPDTRFSGYHGYWPVSSTKVDHRFGNEQVLRELLQEAHHRKINVILDYVANHVHRNHPIYKKHPEWATSLYLPDGSLNTERWDDYRLTTWFDTFMPTLDLENQLITDYMTDSALFWVKNVPFDGFRHDATKHIPLNFWRTLNKKIKTEVAVPNNKRIYQIGETYGNHELIASYLGSGLLDAQFDFNMYDAALPVLSGHNPDLKRLGLALRSSLKTYGSHHLMGNISGNQDKPRFLSYADGNLDFNTPWMEYKRKGWKETIGVKDSNAYRKMALMHAWNMAIPGIPVIYYGDEIGMPGAGDPDNRRMMRFDNLNSKEMQLKQEVSKLAHLRKSWLPLSFGSTRILYLDSECIVIERLYFTQKVWVVMATNTSDYSLSLLQEKHWKLKEQIGHPLAITAQKQGLKLIINTPYSYTYVYFEKQ